MNTVKLKIDAYIKKNETWREELELLRKLLLSTELEETVKWGMPVYTIDNKNVIGLSAFKHHFGLWFYQGVFLKDPYEVLSNAQEGKTKAMRQWRFTEKKELDIERIKIYIQEAIQNQKENKVYKFERNNDFDLSPELKLSIDSNEPLKQAFQKLSKGKQKEYSNYIAEAKQRATKERRLQKIKPMILAEVGLNDKYKKC